MFNIGGFFDRFITLKAKEIGVREVVRDAVKKYIGVHVSIEDIDIKNGIIYIKKLSHAAKNTLFIKKDVVIDEVNKTQSVKKLTHIRF